MAKAATIVTRVIADISDFRISMAKAQTVLAAKTKAIREGIAAIGKYVAAVAAAGAAIAIHMTRRGLESVDAMAKQARAAGGSIAAFNGLERAAKDAGVPVSALANETLSLNRALGEARRGTGTARHELARLGLDAENLAKMDIDERFAALSDAMHGAGYSADQMQIALRNLGIRNRQMVLLMQQGGDSIRDATEEMKAFGKSVDEVDAVKVERANDAMDRIKDVLAGIANQLAVRVSPLLTAAAEKFTEMATEARGFGNIIDQTIRVMIRGFGRIAKIKEDFELIRKAGAFTWQYIQFVSADMTRKMARGFDRFISFAIGHLNRLIEAANLIPGIDITPLVHNTEGVLRGLDAVVDAAHKRWLTSYLQLQRLASQPPAPDRWEAWYDELIRLADEHARAAVEANKRTISGTGEDLDKSENDRLRRLREAAEREAAERQRNAEQSLEQIMALLRTEEEAEILSHQNRLLALREAHELKLIEDEEYYRIATELAHRHQDRLSELARQGAEERAHMDDMGWQAMMGSASAALVSISRMMDSENRRQFQMQKVAATSAAIISGIESVSKTLAAYGYTPAGIAAASAAALGAAAQVAAIQRQQFGGGGSMPSASAMTGGGASAGGGSGPAGGTLTVSGLDPSALFTGAAVQQLAEELLDYQRQGGRVVLS